MDLEARGRASGAMTSSDGVLMDGGLMMSSDGVLMDMEV